MLRGKCWWEVKSVSMLMLHTETRRWLLQIDWNRERWRKRRRKLGDISATNQGEGRMPISGCSYLSDCLVRLSPAYLRCSHSKLVSCKVITIGIDFFFFGPAFPSCPLPWKVLDIFCERLERLCLPLRLVA